MTGYIGDSNLPAVSSSALTENDTVSLGSIGEGEGNRQRLHGGDPTDTVCAVSLSAQAANPTDTETVSPNQRSITSNDTDHAGQLADAANPMRAAAVGHAKMVADAIFDFMQYYGLPWFAIRIDQKRLTERLDMNSQQKSQRTKVWRWTRYAERLGLIARVNKGRPNPSQDEKGIIGWFALITTVPPVDRVPISEHQVAANRAKALYYIDRNAKSKADFEAYCNRIAAHDAKNREREQRKERRKKEWDQTIAAGP